MSYISEEEAKGIYMFLCLAVRKYAGIKFHGL